MSPVTLVVQPGISPAASLGADAGALAAGALALRVYEFAGDVLSLGRYHLLPAGRSGTRVRLHRRHSGGRATAFGDGFVGIALTLPHRSALVSPQPLALAPEQVMNRCVRGILEGLKAAGVAAFYPGRDFITVDRRPLGLVAFEVGPTGALLFEAILANRRDFSLLPAFLDEVDPDGVVSAEMLAAEAATSLARLGATLPLDDVAALVRGGYEQVFGLEFEVARAPAPAPIEEDSWLRQRSPRPELDRHGSTRTQLGCLEAHFVLDGARIADIVLAGDFIANSPAVDELERGLRGSRAERRVVDEVVARVFARPENFVLGIGPLETIAETIMRAMPV